jgi:hypothetical protein
VSALILTGENRTDWRWTSTNLRELLESSGRFDVEVSVVPEAALVDREYRDRFDLFLVDYSGIRWGEAAEANFLEAIKSGTGVVCLSDAVAAFEGWSEYENLVGFRLGDYAYRSNFQEVKFSPTGVEHPILADFGGLGIHQDQLAEGLEQVESESLELLATVSPADGSAEPQAALLAGTYGKGRVVSSPLGNVSPQRRETWASHRNPEAEKLFLRACEWAATGKVSLLERMAHNTLTPADLADGWTLLFDGVDAGSWRTVEGLGLSTDSWNVEGGALRVSTGDGNGDWLSGDEYREFELELDWMVEGGSSTRLGIRRGELDTDHALSLNSEDTGSSRILRPAGEFNHARVVATYDRVEHWLNGVKIKTLYTDPASWARRIGGDGALQDEELSGLPLARIMLDGAGEAIWLRNIKIRHLPMVQEVEVEPVPISLFNGQDLTGWTWNPETPSRSAPVPFMVGGEGQLVGAGLPLGELRSKDEFQDYVLSLDWRFNPVNKLTGAGGILVRGVGSSVQFPDGVEIKLDHRQAGSLFRLGEMKLRADRRRTDGEFTRPIQDTEARSGEWNHLEIRLDGEELLVSLNGQVVNSASGLTERRGAIGIFTRRVELQYRNLTLTPLN